MSSNNQELQAIVKKAYEESVLARQAIEQLTAYKKAIKQDQDALLRDNKILSEAKDLDIKALQVRRKNDEQLSLELREQLNQFKAGIDVSYAVHTNKLPEILQAPSATSHIAKILDDDENAQHMALGIQPKGYDNSIGLEEFQLMHWGNGTIYGNSRSSFLTSALLQTNLALQGEKATLGSNLSWLTDAAVIHAGNLPKQLTWKSLEEKNPNFTTFSFRYKDKYGDALAFVHSGYAFGGARENIGRYTKHNPFLPKDCSSWTAGLTKCTPYSTMHLICSYRLQLGQYKETLTADLLQSNECQDISNNYQAISFTDAIRNPQETIKPGMLISWRNFKDEAARTTNLGAGGHVALTLGLTSQGKALVINYNREMPNIEGFGLSTVSLEELPTKEKMLFSVKSK